MSQSPAPTMQQPTPMKKKVLAALIAVAIGHVGVLFAVSQMQSPELKKIDKEPIKVRFVKITEDTPPPPPPPAEPIKPQVQPKPEPKVVEPPPVEKPKIIAEKPKQKVENAKTIVPDNTQEKMKREQERLEQLRKNQELLEQQRREQALRDQQAREQAQRQQQAREQAERDRLAREQAAAASKPRKLNSGDVSWSRKPAIRQEDVLRMMKPEDGVRTVNLEISSDGTGKVTKVKLISSSGNPKLDDYVVKRANNAKFRPLKENGMHIPFTIEQDFQLSVATKN